MIIDSHTIEINKPGERFGEALPIGNGQMGAMIYGGYKGQKIVLSENTFFSGNKSDNNLRVRAKEAFSQMRKYADLGQYDNVHEVAENFIGMRNNYGTNLPLGALIIDYFPQDTDDRVNESSYTRSLNIFDGTVTENKTLRDCHVKETVFADIDTRAIVFKSESLEVMGSAKIKVEHVSGKMNISKPLVYSDNEKVADKITLCTGKIGFDVHAIEDMHCDTPCGVKCFGNVIVKTDGILKISNENLFVYDFRTLIVCIMTESDFKSDEQNAKELLTKRESEIREADNDYFDSILEKNKKHFSKKMQECELYIDGHEDVAFMFNYGRYLLYSSSNKNSKLPAHLQGIWNDNVACRIGWTCDMHLDINTQMNYWIGETTSLTETLPPLFKWIKEDLVPEGRKTAKDAYGYDGWVGEIVSNAFGYAAPYWASPIAPCPTGGVWILTHMWEHFLYSNDVKFLKYEAFPVIEEVVHFFTQYVYEKEDGLLTCGPSISPENSFMYLGKKYQISSGCTYEILMIRELFVIYRKACEIIYESKKEDNELYIKVCEMLKRLLPYRITKQGIIAEYDHNLEIPDTQHRHTSHLLGVYPFSQITPENVRKMTREDGLSDEVYSQNELVNAVEKTIEDKLAPEDNWEDTGWARSMLLLYAARLQNSEMAYKHVNTMMEKLLEPNGMIYHPPTRGAGAFDNVYELDGNTGLAAGIVEMLMQSHGDEVMILPALPKEWVKGSIKGLRARVGKRIDIKWDMSNPESPVVDSKIY